MTRARARVLLTTAWIAVNMALIFVAGVPLWLVFIGNVIGSVVIGRYVKAFPDAPPTWGERVLRIGAYVVLGTIAACFALLLALTTLAFVVAWLAS